MNPNEYQLVIFWSEEDQAYLVEVPELPGCMADGKTRQEALANAEIVIREWIEAARDLDRPIPQPQGRLLTIPEAASRLGLSVAMVRRHCTSGKLPAQKVGRDWAIRQRDVELFAATPRRSGRPSSQYTPAQRSVHRGAEK
jgi:excisionase family DNA binding protein